ncbi:MAG: hypothetical protein V9E94_18570 [Microthrixaceae bacterium]
MRATGQYVQGLAGPGRHARRTPAARRRRSVGQVERSVSDRDQTPECDSAAAAGTARP